jgi:putative copper export protein
MIDSAWLVLRAAGFVLLLQAAGAGLFLAAFGSRLTLSDLAIRRVGARAAVVAVAVLVAQYFFEPVHMAGEWSGISDPAVLRLASASSAGHALLLRMAALACVRLGLARQGAAWRLLALAGALAALGSFLLTGHTAVNPERAILAPLLFVHLALVAFWFGSLWPLRQLATLEPGAQAARTIAAFSAAAIWLVPVIPLAGAGIAALLLPRFVALWEPYGRLLGVKLALFAVLMVLAALNKRRFAPALARGEPGALARFRRTVALEYVLICATLAASAALTGLYSPAGKEGAARASASQITARA